MSIGRSHQRFATIRVGTGSAWRDLLALLLAIGLLTGCTSPPAVSPANRPANDTPSAPQKALQLGFQTVGEPPAATTYGMGNLIAGREHYFLFHAPLTVYDASEQIVARVAEKVPSVQD